ncbi:MAG: DUF3472 domain-containing protein [Akkermansia sp.]|nr:DUF3472 domain-containing protein [Akkermansia sp.]
MKTVHFLMAAAVALATLCGSTAQADRYSDYWLPENMAKRQCASVHLGYLPSIPHHTAAYQEMVVEKSAPGTYFAANNFGCGYIGVQELYGKNPDGTPQRVAIFSIWDAKDSGDNPNAAPEEERALLIQRGDGVETTRFGGEGTGGKSMRNFPWKEGELIRTLVIERPDGDEFRQIAGYIYDPAVRKWTLMSCWRIQALSRGLGGGCGFVEDFRRNVESKQYERRATFGPAYRWDGKDWHLATEFRFTRDANPLKEINCRIDPKRGWYSLATGGTIAEEADFPVFSNKKIDNPPACKKPGKDVMKLIKAPKLRKIEYKD